MSILALNTKTVQIDEMENWMEEIEKDFMKDIDKFLIKIERKKKKLRNEIKRDRKG